MAISVVDFVDRYGYIWGCCLQHPHPYSPDDIEEVLYHHDDNKEESSSVAVFRLKDGRFGTFDESSDYTGHG